MVSGTAAGRAWCADARAGHRGQRRGAGPMITFDTPLLLYLAPAIAIAVAVLAIWAQRVRVNRARRWSSDLGTLARNAGKRGWIALASATLLAAFALAGPR